MFAFIFTGLIAWKIVLEEHNMDMFTWKANFILVPSAWYFIKVQAEGKNITFWNPYTYWFCMSCHGVGH
jgi:hypothetical protein